MGRYWGQLMHFLEAIYPIKFVKVKYELEYYTKEIFGYFQKKFKQFHISMGVYVFCILNPPPNSLPIPSLWIIPVYQPQASYIMHQTWTGDSFHI